MACCSAGCGCSIPPCNIRSWTRSRSAYLPSPFAVGALFFETDRLGPFLLCAGAALLARTDVALVVLMFGIYALVSGRGGRWTLAPLLLGGGYFLIVMTLIVPAFVHLPAVQCSGPVPPDQIDRAWPGSSNPNLGLLSPLGLHADNDCHELGQRSVIYATLYVRRRS